MDRLPLTSSDPVSDRLARLRDLFPEASSDGKVDLEKLRALLDGSVAAGAERYGLLWAGKSDALKAIQKLTTATLLPAPSESVNWDTTGNAIIEGDNLEVLKVLQHAYYGKVKLIYIDPPYNTGGDFIYPDDYAEGLASYLTYLGQVKDGIKQTTNLDTSGRFHSRWLTMIYPRLFLARNLLREDGVIFVSIDDHEVANLRLVMDEIFGEENFVGCVVWQHSVQPKGYSGKFSVHHNYLLCYQRSGAFELANLERTEEHNKNYANPDGDPNGLWRAGDVRNALHRPNLIYEIETPSGKKIAPPANGWRWSKETVAKKIETGEIIFSSDETRIIRKIYLSSVEGRTPETVWFGKDSGTTRDASAELKELFDGSAPFDTSKPKQLLTRILQLGSSATNNDLILDFFAGSGTTAQAVLELNKEDGGNRRFILVQLPEPTGREDFPTIAEITKERVRRVIQKMSRRDAETAEREREENPLNLPASASPRESAAEPGFKVFKLAESNFAIWNPELAATEPAELAKQWQLSADNVKADASETALLYELLLKSGQPLHARVTTRDAGGVTVHLLDEGRILLCLARVLTREQLRTMADWKPQSVLCLDIAFQGNDALKVNAQLEFQSHGIQFRTA